MKARILRLFAALVLSLAALIAAAIPAHATVYNSFTTFSWSGTSCATATSPVIGNYGMLSTSTVCPGSGFYQINETLVQSGQWIGVRIPLTGQSQVSCTVWLGPTRGLMSAYASDSADGSLSSGEADCLRIVP